jgi:endonuclease-3
MSKTEKLPGKRSFNIPEMFRRIDEAVQPYPKAAMFELFDQGYITPFEQLIACILSIRTLDEVSAPTARKLFARARTPAALAALPVDEIDALIRTSSFHERKAAQIQEIARRVQVDFDGQLPCDAEVMMSFPGVGLKCANLALGIACGTPRVSVDVHVDRVTNRWGYVKTSRPEETSAVLEEKLPPELRVEINRLLVPFGKHICTGRLPKCSTCPVLEYCRQVGVTKHR